MRALENALTCKCIREVSHPFVDRESKSQLPTRHYCYVEELLLMEEQWQLQEVSGLGLYEGS